MFDFHIDNKQSIGYIIIGYNRVIVYYNIDLAQIEFYYTHMKV